MQDRLLVVPRGGHTDSDVSLVWNGMSLSQETRLLRALEAEVWIPGHGDLADAAAMARYATCWTIPRERWRFGSTTRVTVVASSAPLNATDDTRLASNPIVVRR